MLSVKEWIKLAEENGIKVRTFRSRVNRLGWTPEEAAKLPLHKRNRKGEYAKWEKKAEQNGINPRTYKGRVTQYGWSPERAATQPIQRRDDIEWIKQAKKNGISRQTYTYRVDDLFWDPEQAAMTPAMTGKEASEVAVDARAEYKEIIDERIFNDETNMFKLTPQHYEIAERNGIKRDTARARVNAYGWTVQEAITKPILGSNFIRPEGYSRYLETAKKNGISSGTFDERVKRGWSLEDASTKKPSLSNPTRLDREWMELAARNGIERNTYTSRVKNGWSLEQAATTPTLKKGEYLNEETKGMATKGFKRLRGR